MQAITTLIALLALAHSALAGVYITSPVAGTVATGGQVLNVSWGEQCRGHCPFDFSLTPVADDGNTPTVASVGPCTVDLYTGSMTQQTKLQNLAASVDVSKTSSISATIDPTVGQSGNYYFVRFTSLGLKDATNSAYYYEAFSAKFTINSMTGTFSASVLAELAANTTTSSTSAAASGSKTSAVASASSVAAAAASTSKSAALPQLAAPGLLAALVGIAGWIAL
jgi:hypothetical protein